MGQSFVRTKSIPSQTLKDVLLHVFAYLLWLVNIVTCAAAVIQLRSTVNVLWVAFGGDRYSLGVANQVSLLLGGFAAFVYVVFLESYYRQSVTQGIQKSEASRDGSAQPPALRQSRLAQWLARAGLGVLLRRFAITTAIPLGLLVVFLMMNEVALRAMR